MPKAGEPASLWLVDVSQHEGQLNSASQAVLDAEELRRVEAFRVEPARRLYQGAHVALRLLLGACLDLPPEHVELTREPCPCCDKQHGRPAVKGGGVHFSLSHSGEVALLALAAVPVGVDVERVPAASVVEQVARSLHPREAEELAALPEVERPDAFARAWARKEAYLKGIGTGLGRAPSEDYVGTGSLPAAGPDGWTLADIQVRGYAAAVATAAS